MSNVLIVVEPQEGPTGVHKASLAAVSFGQQLVKKTGGALHIAAIGKGAAAAAEAVKGFGAAKVYVIDGPAFADYHTEGWTTAVVAAAKASNATMVAAASSSTSKDCLPRVSVRLEAGMLSDVLSIVDADTFKRPMWAGNVIATTKVNTPVKVATIRATEFAAPTAGGTAEVAKLEVAVDLNTLKSKFVSKKTVKSERPDLATANRVVSGGRGVKAAENFKLIEQLADKLGAAVGASRAVCDAGWAPNDLQIGQTGKVVAPDLYFAIGISGAIQHIAGMKGSKVIVAINKDPEAPIFQVADYGLVADLFKAIPELIEKL